MGPREVKYIAQLNGVRELGLFGVADLSWWRKQFTEEFVEPIDVDGRAQVLVTGLDSRWMGIPFRDITVFIAARSRFGSRESGFFLASAFNASRFMAGVERWWFHLPYQFRGDLDVGLGNRLAFRVGEPANADVDAELGSRDSSCETETACEMGFAGPLFLPRGRDGTRARWLSVRVHGQTSTFEFDAERDRFEIHSEPPDSIFAKLHASGFRGLEWHVRRNATHARSKTFQTKLRS